jgi:hypothetical protein
LAQIDPNRTISAGKVEIGAFRTYPTGYSPPNIAPSEYQSIPLAKIEDFGVHANQYYSLDISIFKSPSDDHILELLWAKHWVNTLSQSSLYSVCPCYNSFLDILNTFSGGARTLDMFCIKCEIEYGIISRLILFPPN